jgi:two-component system chemotaxis sensor kinase CheA
MSTNGLSPEILGPIRAGFLQECEDLLGELETGLMTLQRGEGDWEVVNSVFRAVHSIKGGAAAFGLSRLVRFAHIFETTLAELRAERLAIEPDLLKLLLQASDVLADLVHAERDGGAIPEDATLPLEAALAALVAGEAAPVAADEFPELDFEPIPVTFDDAPEPQPEPEREAAERHWTIRFKPRADLYAKANEPFFVLRELQWLGEVSTTLDDSSLPSLSGLEPEEAYIGWRISLRTKASEAQIREVFAFVEGDCDLALSCDGEIPAEPPVTLSPAAATAAAAAEPVRAAAPQQGQTIRVDLERVDRLINLVGELVINQAMLVQRMADAGLASGIGAQAPLDELDHLTRDLQDSVMAIRAQPVKGVFQRMSRVVREVEAATGKQVGLVVVGEATEVDRTVIERLTDPLTHMIRNSVDHGIESPAQRLAAGKPAQGRLQISAAHRAGRIVIEVADDGRGIDRERVRAVGIKRGLITADTVLADEEIDNLIFAPGFSTAAEVSDVSGRGVGMDVVKSGVQALGGRITVVSRPGEGATFTLSLPLTLAVLDGMVVQVAGHSLVAPLTALLESIQPSPGEIHRLGAGAELLSFRGEHVPLIDLGVALSYRTERPPAGRGVALVVEDDLGGRAALWVDDILGQRQVVIKSLEANYRAVPGVAAATILGDGRVALILDVNAIISAQRREAPPAAVRQLATG